MHERDGMDKICYDGTMNRIDGQMAHSHEPIKNKRTISAKGQSEDQKRFSRRRLPICASGAYHQPTTSTPGQKIPAQDRPGYETAEGFFGDMIRSGPSYRRAR